MALVYKHGTYGEFAETVARPTTQSGTLAVYVGTAPVNLVRGYEAYVNTPVYMADLNAAKRYMGYSDDWASFTLCEAFWAHFDNLAGNVGPIVAINVLDPATHKKAEATTAQLTFVNKRATISSDTIILDTLALADKTEGTDYSIDYDWNKKEAIITDIGETPISTQVQATYSEVDVSMVDKDDVIGGVTAGGVHTGMGCIALIYQKYNFIPNLIAAPGWSHDKEVYEAMITAGTKINGHWDAFVVSDLPVSVPTSTIDSAVVGSTEVGSNTLIDNVDAAISYKDLNGFTNERTKVCWPMGIDSSGRVFHGSTITMWAMLNTDESNNGIPMESPSNKDAFITAQYFGPDSKNQGFDQTRANDLNAAGITTIVYWGARWAIWGPHTAAYKFGAVTDPRVIFDNSLRMMMYISNSFQQEWAMTIDEPMTRALSDTIKNREQEKADALVAVGALIGKPVVTFEESKNSTAELVEGNFVWGFEGTPTPPFKSGTLQVAYTDAGFDTYFGEAEGEV